MDAPASADLSPDEAMIDDLVMRARVAQAAFEKGADQSRYDRAALAVGWAIMQPERNAEMAALAVEKTGLGNVKDKITKNHRKTLGLLRDIQGAVTCGVLSENPEAGITEIARPKGVVGAVVPSTNPVATPANNAINAVKCGNAIILAPSPKGFQACEVLLGYIHAEFDRIGVPRDLVQMVPAPASKIKTQRLMETVDLLVVTGSQDNVRRAYSSGTPALGVGAGNVTVIVDETADVQQAAQKIAASKSFDNSTSCSSENALVVVDAVFDAFMEEMDRAGGVKLSEESENDLRAALFGSGTLNRDMLAKDVEQVLNVAGISVTGKNPVRFLIIEGRGIGPDYPESGEKLSLVLALYRAKDFEDAKAITARILAHQGAGHSVGIHTADDTRARALGHDLPTCRVIVNQAHCFATGGSFDNGMPFSLSMGCGSWGGNSIDDNLNYKHFMNVTKIVRTIPVNEPTLDSVFADYWQVAGK
jgi:sulfoacetaldehyde dehydrogenase